MWHRAWLFFLTAAFIFGCSPGEREISQNILPAAINYYVWVQEIQRLRGEVRARPPEKWDELTVGYQDILVRGSQMLKELTQMNNPGKYQSLMSALDSSLQTQILFMQYESQAVAALVENHRSNSEIDRINRLISGNTLVQARHQAELDRLQQKAQAAFTKLEGLKPHLKDLSQRNLLQMREYNRLVTENKILDYTANEEVLALFSWEQARAPDRTAVKKKPAAKKAASSKSRRSGR